MTSPSSPRRATPPFRHHPDVSPGYTLDLQLPPRMPGGLNNARFIVYIVYMSLYAFVTKKWASANEGFIAEISQLLKMFQNPGAILTLNGYTW